MSSAETGFPETGSPESNSAPPLRLLLVVDGLWVGGTERSLVELLPPLAAAGIEPVVACLTHRSEGVEAEARRAGADLRILPAGGLASQVRSLRRLVREVEPHLCHSSLFRSNLVARLARPGLRCAGRPVPLLNSLVNTPYEPVRFRDPAVSGAKLRLVQAADALSARTADAFHAVSEAVKAAAVRDLRLPPGRIHVVRRGRDPERLGQPSPERRRRARADLGLPMDGEVVVNVGREDFQKGQDVLLQAFALLAPARPALHLVLAGRSGNRSGALDGKLAGLPGADRVHRLGHRDDVPEILAAADLFAFPSRFEGLPGAILEAFALALPVVAADIPPVRELLGDAAPGEPPEGGIRVPPEDPQALAAALAAFLEAPARAKAAGDLNRGTFLREHTLEASTRRMIALYRQVAATV